MAKQYDSFAAYLEDIYYNEIFGRLKSYLITNKSRMNLSTYSVPDPSYVDLSDFHVMGVVFHESDSDQIRFRASVQADIELSGRNRRDYENDSTEFWFAVSFTAALHDGLHNVVITNISEYTKEKFQAEDSLTKYLVPYVYAKDLDSHA